MISTHNRVLSCLSLSDGALEEHGFRVCDYRGMSDWPRWRLLSSANEIANGGILARPHSTSG